MPSGGSSVSKRSKKQRAARRRARAKKKYRHSEATNEPSSGPGADTKLRHLNARPSELDKGRTRNAALRKKLHEKIRAKGRGARGQRPLGDAVEHLLSSVSGMCNMVGLDTEQVRNLLQQPHMTPAKLQSHLLDAAMQRISTETGKSMNRSDLQELMNESLLGLQTLPQSGAPFGSRNDAKEENNQSPRNAETNQESSDTERAWNDSCDHASEALAHIRSLDTNELENAKNNMPQCMQALWESVP